MQLTIPRSELKQAVSRPVPRGAQARHAARPADRAVQPTRVAARPWPGPTWTSHLAYPLRPGERGGGGQLPGRVGRPAAADQGPEGRGRSSEGRLEPTEHRDQPSRIGGQSGRPADHHRGSQGVAPARSEGRRRARSIRRSWRTSGASPRPRPPTRAGAC
jgi:hypothetical protein